MATLPMLEALLVTNSQLRQRLNVCKLPPGLQKHFQCIQAGKTENPSHEMLIKRYRNSLQPFTELPTSNSLSLLAAPTIESYITEHEIILELHQDSFYRGCKVLFDRPEFSDIKGIIDRVVKRMFALQKGNESFAYHISLLNSSFMNLKASQ